MPRRDKYVSLFRTGNVQTSGALTALSPANDWVSIQPGPPGNTVSDGRSILSLVNIRYRSDLTVDTMLRYTVGSTNRDLFVRGVQHVDEAQAEMRLLCEEVV